MDVHKGLPSFLEKGGSHMASLYDRCGEVVRSSFSVASVVVHEM
jgi:hypothetical protein